MMSSPDSDFEVALAFDVLNACKRAGVKLATAESCTGGLVAAALTAIPGSSDVVERGFVTYSNVAKEEMLAVSPALLRAFGAVSEPVAKAMAEGALNRSHADIAVSITGVAGPGGGTPEKPVGLVHFGLARRNRPTLAAHSIFPGDRAAVRRQAVDQALTMVLEGLA
jgi:nicotinamide-nucleotide amidase